MHLNRYVDHRKSILYVSDLFCKLTSLSYPPHVTHTTQI